MISPDAIRGYVDLMVLSILEKKDSYAYELAKTISKIAGGDYQIKQTTLYSAVKRMESAGIVSSYPATSESGKARTYYRISDAGRAYLIEKRSEWEQIKVLVDRFVEGMI